MGNAIVGEIQYSNQQEKLRSTLDKAGVKYSLDADGNPQADPSQRASFKLPDRFKLQFQRIVWPALVILKQ